MKLCRSSIDRGLWIVLAAALVLASARAAHAQAGGTGAIAGVVKDTSGGVLPGVTVTAESPALIGGAREVTTDEHGEYKILNLRPGVYTVTFALTGFTTVRRTDLELTTTVTLPVYAELKLGTFEETVTVSGESPLVDVQNANLENVITDKVIQTLPTGMGIPAYAQLTLGATQTGRPDVGGNQGEANNAILLHNSRTNNNDALWDGMSYVNGVTTGGLGQRSWLPNKISIQEVTISTTSDGPEGAHPGPNVNFVPRQGGDQFHAIINATGANSSFETSNLDDDLRARGLLAVSSLNYTYDVGAGVGGPLAKGKLWFWTGYGDWSAQQYVPGNYWNATQDTLFYTPDLERQAYSYPWNRAVDGRLDWRVSSKDTMSFFESVNWRCACFQGIENNRSPEATQSLIITPSLLTQFAWNRVQTSKLLFKFGVTSAAAPGRENTYAEGVETTDVPIVLQNTGYGYHAFNGLGSTTYGKPLFNQMNGIANMVYATGSHAVKAGFSWHWNDSRYDQRLNIVPNVGPVAYLFNQPAGAPRPVPVQLTQYASPQKFISRSWVNALYVNDQWTVRNMTLNLGLRFDWQRGYAPATHRDATTFTPALDFPAVKGIPHWNDFSPRIGFAYDLFKNGRSAFKGGLGRFVIGDYTSTTVANTPANAIVTSANRTWTDSNGNYFPDCDLRSPLAQNTSASGGDICGALANNGFGGVSTGTTYDPDVLKGWHVRPYNWQSNLVFEQQLKARMAVAVGYYRTWYGNFNVTENTAVPSSEYGTYCITGPVDSRVDSLTGETVCGFHDVNPGFFGRVQNLVTSAKRFGTQSEVYNGFDIALRGQFARGGFFQGGFATGRISYDACDIANNFPNVTATQTNPNGSVSVAPTTPAQFCSYTTPWSSESQVKGQLNYPLPWYGIEASVVYQNLPGAVINSSYVATNAQIAASLGRPPSSGAATVTLNNALYTPFSEFEGRLNQLDLRFTKVFSLMDAKMRIRANFDIYNVGNSNTILGVNSTYSTSTTYLRPTGILGGRLFKFGTSINF